MYSSYFFCPQILFLIYETYLLVIRISLLASICNVIILVYQGIILIDFCAILRYIYFYIDAM